tara:strand:+ start:511 stop:1425 length:915 start_codon:yes stop_codon:yes gene_type:complete
MTKLKILDGGTGSEIRRRGYNVPSHVNSIWSAQALIEHPEVIEQIHYDYIHAGANYITINNYALTQPILSRANILNKLEELTLLSIELANNAIKRSGKDIKIIGSLPPLETSYRSDLVINEKDMYENYKKISSILKNKVDIIICETMSSIIESKTALVAALESDTESWISWTLQGNRLNTLPSGESLKEAFEALNKIKPDAYLINCCAANFVTEGIKTLNTLTDKPIGGYANSVLVKVTKNSKNIARTIEKNPEEAQKMLSKNINEWDYSKEVKKWIKNGASIIGGCCSTTPNHIKEVSKINDQ